MLLYGAGLNRGLMDYLMGTTMLETQFVSVERVAEYVRLPQECEEPQGEVEQAQAAKWPTGGAISLRGIVLGYAVHMPSALSGIDLEISSGSKVALCGRTGCGKSSLLGVLTRLYPVCAGKVEIDGYDLSSMSHRQLRRAVQVVAQDAFLVSGTVEDNLYPNFKSSAGSENKHHAEHCWHVLKMVGMADRISSAGGLNAVVLDGGKNFSVGERQLLALARALMPQDSKCTQWLPPTVLLCDEATASVDLVADGLVHNVLLGLDSTLVMICHRLQYISRFDRVAVLDAGKVVEYDSPKVLLANPSSKLSALCSEAGVHHSVDDA